MMKSAGTLADRLGKTVHVSPLRYKLAALKRDYPAQPEDCLEDWFVRVANARGWRVVVPTNGVPVAFTPPPGSSLSNEELAVAICQLQSLDRPQILRLAAQMISRGSVEAAKLRLIAERERVGPVLAELARQALRVAPRHPTWRAIHDCFGAEPRLREPLLHWTRLAEPIPKDGKCDAAGWRLVA